MKIWLIQANEPMPKVDENQRLFRTGMLADELNKRHHNIIWFAATFDHYTKKQRFNENKSVEINQNYKLQFLNGCEYTKNISFKRIINHIQIARNFKKLTKGMEVPDVIYCSFPTIYLSKLCVKYSLENNVKVIIDVRDLWPEVFERAVPKKFMYLVSPIFHFLHNQVNWIFSNATAINGVTKEFVDYVLMKINRERQPLDKEYFIGYTNDTEDVFTKKMAVTSNKKMLIPYIGTLGSQINYDLIIEVAKLTKSNIEFIICGDGPLKEKFQDMSKDQDNIKFVGWINAIQIREYLEESFLALIPYKNTLDFQMGAGNKFGEALSYSLPVIVMCEGVMKRLVEEFDCGIASLAPNIIAEYINTLSENQSTYIQTSENAQRLYQKQFRSKTIYTDVADYIENTKEETK